MATNTSNSSGRSTSGQQERETILLTPEGYEEKKARLEFLKKRREEIADYIHEAKEAGDISESSAYEDAKNSQAMNEGAILELTGDAQKELTADRRDDRDDHDREDHGGCEQALPGLLRVAEERDETKRAVQPRLDVMSEERAEHENAPQPEHDARDRGE